MFNQFLDLSEFTPKQLHEKINSITANIGRARAAGMNNSIIENMQTQLEMIYEELNTRTAFRIQEKHEEDGKGNGICFDIEKYLEKSREDLDKDENPRKQNYKPGW